MRFLLAAVVLSAAVASAQEPSQNRREFTIVAKDPKVLDRIAGWGWTDGLKPDPAAPVWRMDTFRDRFLAAGQGGYYVESSVLQGGLVRGHFHTACRILDNQNAAPAPDPVPAFFVATEDNKGGAAPDTVAIQVPGLPQSGTFQCSSWAGDGSHRTPMMERANQTPAFDSVRIQVR